MDDMTLGFGLIALGLVLLLADFLLMSGILMALSLASMLGGLAFLFRSNASYGLGTLIVLLVAVPVLISLLVRFWQRTPLGKRFILQAPAEDDTLATMPGNMELEQLRGRFGQTVSALRPSGITAFDGRRVDTVTEGDMIEPGQWVRCIDVQAGRVIVRAVDGPPDLANMDTAEFH
jgi:membrane-bound ClpP family serine protease